jgi:hypothetical protein
MKNESYKYKAYDKYKKEFVEKTVEAISIFDINKATMRCLVKNLAMFGLGLHYYAGQDLPFGAEEDSNDTVNNTDSLNADLEDLDFIYSSIKEAKTVADLINVGKELLKPLDEALQDQVRPTYMARKNELEAKATVASVPKAANQNTLAA